MTQVQELTKDRTNGHRPELVPSPLLPNGYVVPASRWTHPSTTMRRLLETEPYLFGPGVYDPMGAQLVMYHGFKAVYFSGYSFAIGHLGTTDMDIYDSVEIADAARRTVSALRKFQLTMAVRGSGEGHRSAPSRDPARDRRHGRRLREHLQRPAHGRAVRQRGRRRGPHRGPGSSQALRPHRRQGARSRPSEMVGKLRMARAVADDLGNATS